MARGRARVRAHARAATQLTRRPPHVPPPFPRQERTLAAKLKKKRAELERAQKRLESLQSVRPAFMDEYERLEKELAVEYEAYITRYRNLDFLHVRRRGTRVRARTRAHAKRN